MIQAKIVADSLSPQGNRITTMQVTFPRFILAELNTHRLFSRNSASSRAIPFEKMVKSVEENPFIPIAWQKDHKGMQGTEYFTDVEEIKSNEYEWLKARDYAIKQAIQLNQDFVNGGVTKQLCNRLLEPFMWHTVLCTSTEWENFFNLRCPQYCYLSDDGVTPIWFKSRKDFMGYDNKQTEENKVCLEFDELGWLIINKGQSEIHMMALAEAMYDAMNESVPKQLKAGNWHIPFGEKIYPMDLLKAEDFGYVILGDGEQNYWGTEHGEKEYFDKFYKLKVKIATARCARVSYTVVGELNPRKLKIGDKYKSFPDNEDTPLTLIKSIEHDAGLRDDYCYINGEYVAYEDIFEIEKASNFENDIKLHDTLATSGHWSPFEHCARAMSDYEYSRFTHTFPTDSDGTFDEVEGWCNNFRGFIQYRYLLENQGV